MSAGYVRGYYGVAFKVGDRLTVDGRPGVLVSFPGQYLGVRFDGERHTSRCHPTWRVLTEANERHQGKQRNPLGRRHLTNWIGDARPEPAPCSDTRCPGWGERRDQRMSEQQGPSEGTFWNGLPIEAVRGTAVVADAPAFPRYWAKVEGIIGQRIPVVRVVLDGANYGGGIYFLDDRDGSGWHKVTIGHGGPAYGHRGVEIEADSFTPDAPRAARTEGTSR